jgi:hypothetical protein
VPEVNPLDKFQCPEGRWVASNPKYTHDYLVKLGRPVQLYNFAHSNPVEK